MHGRHSFSVVSNVHIYLETIEIAFLSINVVYEVRDDNGLVKVIIMFADTLQHINAQDDSNNYVIIM